MLKRRLTVLVTVAVAASSCAIRYFDEGVARLSWSIAGRKDPETCEMRASPSVHIVLRRDAGDVVADELATCSSFETTYLLRRGWYMASITLVDASRAPVSETRDTNAFYVTPSFDALAVVDFALAPTDP